MWERGDKVGVGCRASNVVGLGLDGPEGIASFAAVRAVHGQGRPTL